jgi:hypothetical protein
MEVFAMVSGGLFLFWCVLTKSLPYVLATSNPEYALWLNADNPPALRNVAERARQDLLELTAPDIQTPTL